MNRIPITTTADITMAIKLDDLNPVGELDQSGMLTAMLAGCVAIACLLIVLIIVLSRPRTIPPRAPRPKGAHHPTGGTRVWHQRIDAVVQRYHAQDITRDQAFTELAAIAREYASGVSGTVMATQTLSDLNRATPPTSGKEGFTLLRQTIAALYPPQFADERYNDAARTTSVEQGAEWVSALVERWRR